VLWKRHSRRIRIVIATPSLCHRAVINDRDTGACF
jgi:hypothetical protein